jgi:pantoate--beta-alanine ligase
VSTSDATPVSPAPPRRAAVIRCLPDLRAAVAALRAAGRGIAFVPTMGALHEGHLTLVRAAARDGDAPVVSIFVNPAQFGPGEDLQRYPRQEERDVALAESAGAALVFCPPVDEVYPPGFATTVTVGGPAEGLEGARRPGHFAGVATVVARLLLMVRPDRLLLGRKDAQQVAVVRRMMRDLAIDDVVLEVVPTVREPDGVAMSSRNAYLGPDDRRAARALSRGLAAAEALAAGGERDGALLQEAAAAVMRAEPGVEPDYAALVDPETFAPVALLEGTALLCVAARVGPARLIDNAPIAAS